MIFESMLMIYYQTCDIIITYITYISNENQPSTNNPFYETEYDILSSKKEMFLILEFEASPNSVSG